MFYTLNQLAVSPNISLLDKDAIQSAFWIITAVIATLGLMQNTSQRRRELRWRQATFAKQIIDELMKNEKASEALSMIDELELKIKASGDLLSPRSIPEIKNALTRQKTSIPDSKEIEVCFYQLFFSMNRLEQAIEIELIRFEDVTYPFYYYLLELEKPNNRELKEAFKEYMGTPGFKLAFKFWKKLENFYKRRRHLNKLLNFFGKKKVRSQTL